MAKVVMKRKHRQLCLGDLNKRIKIDDRSIQTPNFDSVDASERFSGVKEIWAKIETTSGQTVFVVNQDISFTHIISIRFDSQVTTENWIKFEGNFYKILTIQDLEERHEWLLMRCVERGDVDTLAAQA